MAIVLANGYLMRILAIFKFIKSFAIKSFFEVTDTSLDLHITPLSSTSVCCRVY